MGAEVTNVSARGVWLRLRDREVLLSFDVFRWFLDATIAQILRVEFTAPNHLYWPDLDVDLSVESIEHPEQFPLVSRRARKPRMGRTAAAKR